MVLLLSILLYLELYGYNPAILVTRYKDIGSFKQRICTARSGIFIRMNFNWYSVFNDFIKGCKHFAEVGKTCTAFIFFVDALINATPRKRKLNFR